MAGTSSNVDSENTPKQSEDFFAAAEDIQLSLELPDGTVFEETFKSYRNVASIATVVKDKIEVRFEDVKLFLGEQKLENLMSLRDLQIKSGATLRVVLFDGSFKVGCSKPLLINIGVWLVMGLWLSISSTDSIFIYFLFVLTGWSLCCLVHEMGHAAFAAWAGDKNVEHYTAGNFVKWDTIGHNYVIPLIATGILGVGINGGMVWVDEKRLQLAGTSKRMLVAFGGILSSIGFSIILAFPLWLYSTPEDLAPKTTWLLCGIATVFYFNIFSILLNILPFPPMDMFNILFPLLPKHHQEKISE